MVTRKRLVFVSTRFLFPVDSGGKIRTTQILRGMKGGAYEITLLMPATPAQLSAHAAEIESVCDRCLPWAAPRRGRAFHYTRLRHLLDPLPIPVRTDLLPGAVELVASTLGEGADVAVFDFLHAAVLAPEHLDVPSVLFTHNVEAEIFARHRDVAGNPLMAWLWKSQHRKMAEFEAASLRRFDAVVAVSDRDAVKFEEDYGATNVSVIPTGVDLDFFRYDPPDRSRDVVFLGSMDWLANQDAMAFFMDDVWPLVVAEVEDARMTVVGRAPPAALVERAKSRGLAWTFTGFVDDVRPTVAGAAVSVIPIRVGGGTRLKVFEAMAMGSPVVSTTVGVEGLPIEPDSHYLLADEASTFAVAVARLLLDSDARHRLAGAARRLVEERFSFRFAARAFESICDGAAAGAAGAEAVVAEPARGVR